MFSCPCSLATLERTMQAPRAVTATLDKLRRKLRVFPGFRIADNGVCLLYNAKPRQDGYISVTFRHPLTSKLTCSSVHRVAVMLDRGTLSLPRHLDASHLCHNKACILMAHISLEPREVNTKRRLCAREGRCRGHPKEGGSHYPPCLKDKVGLLVCRYDDLTTLTCSLVKR